MASSVHQVSRAPRALVGHTAVLTRPPRKLGTVPEGPWGRNNSPGHSGLYPRPRGVDHLSRVTRAWILGPTGPASSPGPLRLVSKSLRCQPAVPGDSGPCPRCRGVDQLSRVTLDRAQGAAVSTSCPRRLGPVSEGLRC